MASMDTVEKEVKLCKCGCGEPVKQRRDKTYNDFINHHSVRLNCHFNTKEFKESMTGDKNPSKRPEVRAKISKSLKGKYSGEKNHMKQEKYRKMFSEMRSGEKNPMYGKKCPEQSIRMKKNNPMHDPLNAKKSLEHRMKLSKIIKKKIGIDENSEKWDIFLSPVQEKIRKLQEYKSWRNKVFEKDNYICQNCGYSKGGILNAHHSKKFFHKILIDNNINTIEEAKKCEELWDVSNGETLCKKCHTEIHKKDKDIDN